MLKNKLESNNKEIDDLGKEKEQVTGRIEAAGERLTEIDDLLAQANENPDLLSADDRNQAIEERNGLQDEVNSLTKRRGELDNSIATKNDELESLRAENEDRSKDLLTDEQTKALTERNTAIEAEIEPVTERIRKNDEQIGDFQKSRDRIAGRLGEVEEKLKELEGDESKEAEKQRSRLEKQRRTLRKADKGFEEGQNFLSRRNERLSSKIQDQTDELAANQEALANDKDAREVIAANTEREAVLTTEIEEESAVRKEVVASLSGAVESRDAVQEVLDKDQEGRDAISALRGEREEVTEQRVGDRERIGEIDERREALVQQNQEIQDEIDELAASGQGNTDPAQAEEDLIARRAAIADRLVSLGEESDSLTESRDKAQVELDGIASEDELNDQRSGFVQQRDAAQEDLTSFDESSDGKQLATFREKEQDFLDKAARFRAEDKEKQAQQAEKKAEDFAKKAEPFQQKRDEITDRIDTANEGIEGVDRDLTRRGELEDEISAADKRLGQIDREEAAGNEEVKDIDFAVKERNTSGGIDTDLTDEEIDGLSEARRGNLIEKVDRQIGKNNDDLSAISSRLQEIDETEERINTLNGKVDEGTITDDEREELAVLQEQQDSGSLEDQRTVLEARRGEIESANGDLRNFNEKLRDVDQGRGPTDPPEEPGEPIVGAEELSSAISASITVIDNFSTIEEGRIAGAQAQLSGRISDAVTETVDIDVLANQNSVAVEAVQTADVSQLFENLANDVAQQIRQAGQNGQGDSAVNSAFSRENDIDIVL